MKETIKEKYPWLLPHKTYSIDLIYDKEDKDEEDMREASAAQDTAQTAKEIFEALTKTGNKVNLIPVEHGNYKETLSNLKGDIVFNQVEEDELGYKVLDFLETLKKPVTGIGSSGFKLSWLKDEVKELLIKKGIPTPKYFIVPFNQKLGSVELKYPLFVKAADDHGSLSINKNSFVKDKNELSQQIDWVKQTIGGNVLVEEYIDGRELSITALGNGNKLVLFPTKEIMFGKEFLGKPKIITFDAKWTPSSPDYIGTESMQCPADLTPLEEKNITKFVIKTFKVLKCRDYVRFDIRLKDNIPYFIDYNANPALGFDAASSLPAKVFGLTYPEFISSIVAVALKRYKL